ncbi:hypothetical protein RY831_28675 [Noviherbaspirillum sp. CPCC 100848]|uniref:Transmembrane protein n=1 Tax=Noviherbaspirillum album TaxID=3080276 RepID=A0ABU6JIA4_9BURK|nr:hypothetical protein [Noviherbaspirillum sp. CPCC 100848]MEC4723138.1 hypothetical protein [Noviherbaspirillum sp. CPCC 100848]
MSLPELEWQILYGRFAWAMVLAALLVALLTAAWPRARRMPAAAIAFLLIGAVLLAMLPGAASFAYWLGLALQWPSGLLVGLSLGRLYLNWKGAREQAVMPPWLAIPIALAGSMLYLDAVGLVALGVYYVGFGPVGAPVAALVLMLACATAAALGYSRLPALALLLATAIFTVLRLPTGNLWDALLDPVLWTWSLVSLISMGKLRAGARRRERLGQDSPQAGYASVVNAQTAEDIGKSA